MKVKNVWKGEGVFRLIIGIMRYHTNCSVYSKSYRDSKERTMKSTDRIPAEVLKEIFPKRLKRRGAPEGLYTHLKRMILSGKVKEGQKLTYDGIALDLNVRRGTVHHMVSRLKKDQLIIWKWRKGSFVA